MGLLDSLFSDSSYGGQGGGLLDFLKQAQLQNAQYQPSAGLPPIAPAPSFADRFNAMPGAPQPVNPQPRQLDASSFDPATFAPNQAQPLNVGGYQMPRVGSADLYQPAMNAQAAIPPNAQPTQGQLPPGPSAPQDASPQQLPPALGGNSFGGNLGASLQSFANTPGGLIPKLVGGAGALFTGQRSDPQGIQQQNLKAQYDSLVPILGPQKAMLAVMNPEAGKTLLQESLTNKADWGVVGEDALGNKQYGWINKLEQTINGKGSEESPGGSNAGTTFSFLAPGVKQIDSTLQGKDYINQFSPEVQQAAKDYIAGKALPTGNPRKGFTQAVQMVARKYAADIGDSVDDATYSARRTMRNQLSSSAPASLGGQINIGNTAAGHLADLSQKALDLGNYDTGLAPLTAMVNNARGLGTEQAAKMEALKGAAQHYGQEITKFYAGSPGGTAERDRFIESVNGARSPKELAAILATEGELMRSRLDALGGQIKGVLGEEGATQYPVLRKDGQDALAKVEENVARLKGGQSSNTTNKPATVIQNGHTYTLQPDGSYK